MGNSILVRNITAEELQERINQKYNEALEIMCNKLEIEIRSTHNGRDTFITRAIDAGVSIPTLMKWVGQESYVQLKIYIALLRVC